MSNPLGTTAIIAFEYILTLGQEIDYFWRGKFTGASVLFFLTRYLAVLVNVIETSGFANITPKVQSLANSCPNTRLLTVVDRTHLVDVSPHILKRGARTSWIAYLVTFYRCTPYVRAGSILSAIQYLPWGGKHVIQLTTAESTEGADVTPSFSIFRYACICAGQARYQPTALYSSVSSFARAIGVEVGMSTVL